MHQRMPRTLWHKCTRTCQINYLCVDHVHTGQRQLWYYKFHSKYKETTHNNSLHVCLWELIKNYWLLSCTHAQNQNSRVNLNYDHNSHQQGMLLTVLKVKSKLKTSWRPLHFKLLQDVIRHTDEVAAPQAHVGRRAQSHLASTTVDSDTVRVQQRRRQCLLLLLQL